ncbi:mobile genetic element [Streptococcus pneumoniae]|nr:mobile genetic element [Streptococcus pneumoniae]
MNYEASKQLTDARFKRLVGVQRFYNRFPAKQNMV